MLLALKQKLRYRNNYIMPKTTNLISVFLLLVVGNYHLVYSMGIKNTRDKSNTRSTKKIKNTQVKDQDKLALSGIAEGLKGLIENIEQSTGWEKREEQKSEILSYIIKDKISWKEPTKKPENFETIYWDRYQFLVPVNDLSTVKLTNKFPYQKDSSKIIAIIRFRNDWVISLCLNSYGRYEYNDYSEMAHTIFEGACKITSLSDQAKLSLQEKLQGRMLFQNDLDLLQYVWSKDYSNPDINHLRVAELFETYYSMYLKLTIWPATYMYLGSYLRLPGAEIETGCFQGLMFGNLDLGLEYWLFDENNYIQIECTNDKHRRTGEIDFNVLKLSLSTMSLHKSQTPAKDMLEKAQKYLKTSPQASMVYIRAAQQYPDDEQTTKKITTCQNQAIDKLIANLQNENPQVKISSMWWLRDLEVRKARDYLVKAADDEDPSVREWAVRVLSDQNIGTEKEILKNILMDKFENDENPLVRSAAIYELGSKFHDFGLDDVYLKKIINAASDQNPIIRREAICALRMIKPEPKLVMPVYYKALNDEDAEVRSEAQLTLEFYIKR